MIYQLFKIEGLCPYSTTPNFFYTIATSWYFQIIQLNFHNFVNTIVKISLITKYEEQTLNILRKTTTFEAYWVEDRTLPWVAALSSPILSKSLQASKAHWITASFFFPDTIASATIASPVGESTGNLKRRKIFNYKEYR